MECDDYSKKFKEIDGWEMTKDGRKAFMKIFKFSDSFTTLAVDFYKYRDSCDNH